MVSMENFILVDLTYIPIGMQHPVYARPYVVNATAEAVNTITDRMHDARSGKVTASIIGDQTGNIIQTSAVPQPSGMDQNWASTRRFIFLLKVKSFDAMGSEINSYIQGYTEYDGITPNGNIDPQLVHYINNIIETTEMTLTTPMGVMRREKLYRIYNVFAPTPNGDLYTQRPVDVLGNINMLQMATFAQEHGGSEAMTPYNFGNMLNPFNANLVSSTVDNCITTEYLTRILNTGMLYNRSKEIHLGSFEVGQQDSTENHVPEPSINDNRFVKHINNQSGFRMVRPMFNFGQLMAVDQTIFQRFKLFNITKDFQNPVAAMTPDVGEFWSGQDPVTVKAYSLIENSVSLATKYGFNKLYFVASNMTNPTGMADIFITNFGSFINLEEHEFQYLLEIFKQKFLTEIYLAETMSGQIPLHMEMYVDLLGTSKINLTYAGFPQCWYTVPTTANSLFSPVVTADKGTLDFTSHSLGTVIDALSSNESVNRQYF